MQDDLDEVTKENETSKEEDGNGESQDNKGSDSAVSAVSEEDPGEEDQEQGEDPDQKEMDSEHEEEEKESEEEKEEQQEEKEEETEEQEKNEEKENVEGDHEDRKTGQETASDISTIREILEDVYVNKGSEVSVIEGEEETETIEEQASLEYTGMVNGLAVTNFSIGLLVGVILIKMIFSGVFDDE